MTPNTITAAHTAAAAEIRELLTSALHGQPLPESITCRLAADLRQAATPAACHLLRGQKSVIESVVAGIIAYHHAAACDELRAICRGD